MKKLNVKVIGCGGVGGCLLNVLPRYLSHLRDNSPTLTVIDGDEYEHRNSERQRFNVLGNKAVVTADLLRREYPDLMVSSLDNFVTKTNVALYVKEGDVVFCCVDNHATRKLLSDQCEKLRNVVLISGGNGEKKGNVLVHVRKDGIDKTNPITYFHRDIQNPKDVNPGERDPGCDVQIDTTPQIIWVNNAVAALMGMALQHLNDGVFDGDKAYDEVYFNGIDGIATRTAKR